MEDIKHRAIPIQEVWTEKEKFLTQSGKLPILTSRHFLFTIIYVIRLFAQREFIHMEIVKLSKTGVFCIV